MSVVRVNGVRLRYELEGEPTAPTVVFVNGLLTDLESWTAHLPFFRDRYRLLRYDCRGQGGSDAPAGPYETAQHAADLGALLDALAIDRPALVGLSNGGAAALHVAADRPGRIAALVVCGSYAYADALLRAKLWSWIQAMASGGPALRFDVATPWIWGRTFYARHAEEIAAFRERGAALSTDAALALIGGAMRHDARAALGRITAPTLVLVGTDDLLTPPWMSRQIADGVPHAELGLLEDAGHAAALEQVERFGATVRAFLDRADKADRAGRTDPVPGRTG